MSGRGTLKDRGTLAKPPGTGSTSGTTQWAPATAYGVGQLVTRGGQILAAASAHTSGASWDTSKWINPTPFRVYDPSLYGAAQDLKRGYDGLFTNTSTTFTSATGTFTTADIGKTIAISSATAGVGVLVTTITAVASATSITLAAAAGRTGGGQFTYGTDDNVAVTAAFNDAKAAATSSKPSILWIGAPTLTTAVTPSLDNTVNFKIVGAGSGIGAGTTNNGARGGIVGPSPGVPIRAVSELCYVGAAAGPFIHANDAVGFTIDSVSIRYHTSSLTGAVVQTGSDTLWGYLAHIKDAQIAGFDSNSMSASSLLDVQGPGGTGLGGAIEILLENVTLQYGQRGIKGPCNVLTMIGGHIGDYGVAGIDAPLAIGWTFLGVTFEPGVGGTTGPVAQFYPAPAGQGARGVTFDGCNFWDTFSGAAVLIKYAGYGLRVVNSTFAAAATGGTVVELFAGAVINPGRGLTFTGNNFSYCTGTWVLFSVDNVTDGSAYHFRNFRVDNNICPAGIVTDNSKTLSRQVHFDPFQGSIAPRIVSVTAAYAADATDGVIKADATGGAFSVTLPDVTGADVIAGTHLTIKKIDSSANLVTVATTSSQNIDGATTYTGLATQWKTVTLVADKAASKWLIVNAF